MSAAAAFIVVSVSAEYYHDRREWLHKYKLEKAKYHQLSGVDPIGAATLSSKLYVEAIMITQPEIPGWAFWISEYKDSD